MQLIQTLQVIQVRHLRQSKLQHKRHQISPHKNSSLVPCLLSKRLQLRRIDFPVEMRTDYRFRL